MTDDQPGWIDTHFHLLNRKGLTYSWLEEMGAPWSDIMGDYTPLVEKGDYPLEDYLAEALPTGVVKLVHAEAAFGAYPPDETAWLQNVADKAPIPLYSVGRADLSAPDIGAVLDRHCDSRNFLGVRMLWGSAQADTDAFRAGFRELASRDLIFEDPSAIDHYGGMASLAKDFPGTRVLLGHCGMPMQRDKAYLDGWRAALKPLAEHDNIHCKLSGVPMTDHRWTPESLREIIESAIEIFGPDRCFFGSNWPVDSLFVDSFADLVSEYRRIIASYSPDEQVAMLSGNAERFYRI